MLDLKIFVIACKKFMCRNEMLSQLLPKQIFRFDIKQASKIPLYKSSLNVSIFIFRRVMELFTLDWTLSRKLRIPTISRLQNVHNVDVALQVLKDKGVDLKDEYGEFHDHK